MDASGSGQLGTVVGLVGGLEAAAPCERRRRVGPTAYLRSPKASGNSWIQTFDASNAIEQGDTYAEWIVSSHTHAL